MSKKNLSKKNLDKLLEKQDEINEILTEKYYIKTSVDEIELTPDEIEELEEKLRIILEKIEKYRDE